MKRRLALAAQKYRKSANRKPKTNPKLTSLSLGPALPSASAEPELGLQGFGSSFTRDDDESRTAAATQTRAESVEVVNTAPCAYEKS